MKHLMPHLKCPAVASQNLLELKNPKEIIFYFNQFKEQLTTTIAMFLNLYNSKIDMKISNNSRRHHFYSLTHKKILNIIMSNNYWMRLKINQNNNKSAKDANNNKSLGVRKDVMNADRELKAINNRDMDHNRVSIAMIEAMAYFKHQLLRIHRIAVLS